LQRFDYLEKAIFFLGQPYYNPIKVLVMLHVFLILLALEIKKQI